MKSLFIGLITLFLLSACGGANDGDNDNDKADQQALINEINNRFPYTANQPVEQLFVCSILNSNLVWYFDFLANGGIDLYVTLDNHSDLYRTGGSYTHQNNQLTISIQNDAVNLPNEVTTQITTAMGMIESFTSPNLQCVTIGHSYNTVEFTSTVHFQCPYSNIQAASQDENAIEFVHASVSSSFYVPGSSFRQRDRYVDGMANPLIRLGYGIYRRDGDRFYIYFPRNQFDDYDYLSGTFGAADNSIQLEQTEVAVSACGRS